MGRAASDGPDVIVGDLSDFTQYTLAAEDPQSYAIGTTSCNIGNDVLQWVSFNAQHPVIATNMYRLSTVGTGLGGTAITRIEQIGQSWLKHGFIALAGSTCAVCPEGSPQGSVLGVGCSDPYSASLNGTQQLLGPRSEVNPATGVFPFPISWAAFPDRTGDGFGDAPVYNGVLARRVIVPRSEMLTPGAQYFAEGQYVSADDAAAGNKHNNASYQRLFVDTGSMGIGASGATERTKPAIFAWRDHGLGPNMPDASVVLTPIDVPGDGRFWLASRVTQLTATTWRYEYALQNLNSDRGAYSFAVSVGTTTSTSNPGFRDINPHSDEIWDGADWTRPLSGPAGGLLVWNAQQTPTANPRGNALRWGTLYNFWFDANRAPATGQVSIGLFKGFAPGTPNPTSHARAAAPTPGGALTLAAPTNDTCAAAAAIGRNEFAFSTIGANDGTLGECASPGGSTAIVKDIWFSYTHSGPGGDMTVSTCGSSFNTKIAVYAGPACPTTSLTALACSDDSAACTDTTSSRVLVPVVNGQTYLIRVGGSPAAATANQWGNGILTITPPPLATGACCRVDGSCQVTRPAACNASYLGDATVCAPNPCPQPPPPANDLCADAQWIADGVPITATNRNANTDGTSGPCANGGAKDVWYKYRPLVTGEVRITTDNAVEVNGVPGGQTDFDTVLAVVSACGGPLVACDDDGGTSPEVSSDINTVNLEADRTYLIRVAAYPYTDAWRQVGTFTLKVIGGGGVLPVSGACCTGTACVVGLQSACGAGSTFAGAGTACGPVGNPTTCCPANFNGVGGVTVQDVFEFLVAYFGASPSADFNGVGGVTVQDVFDFLVAYFRGCAG